MKSSLRPGILCLIIQVLPWLHVFEKERTKVSCKSPILTAAFSSLIVLHGAREGIMATTYDLIEILILAALTRRSALSVCA